MPKILIGISSWADAELIASGFYPPQLKTPAERLRYYAANFPIAEVDSSYHFLPTGRNLAVWIESTPPGFLFEVKAFSLLTHHPTRLSSLPRDLRDKAAGALNKEGHLYLNNLPAEITGAIWERFANSIRPLALSGKLGPVTFQFPPWFHPGPDNREYIAHLQEKLPQYRLAIEFRAGSWLNDQHRSQTLEILREHGLALVCVDEPQGLKSSVPPLAELTSSFGIVRFHGRNRETWEQKNVRVSQKYNYLYSLEELKEWAPKIQQMAASAEQIYVIFKNKHGDFPTTNARQMMALLETAL